MPPRVVACSTISQASEKMQVTGLGRRLLSMLYDALLVLALFVMTTLVFVAKNGGEFVPATDKLLYQVTLSVVCFAFFVGFWTRSGRTLGMQSWGLQLETPEGHRASFAAASLRFFAVLLSWIPLGLGFFWQLWDREKLTWHDRISKTRIVYYAKKNQ
jgi:uncharacterized RDD family membrane protein YckC